jgi:hypothetical protein
MKPNPLDQNLKERQLAHTAEDEDGETPPTTTPRGQDVRSPPFATSDGSVREAAPLASTTPRSFVPAGADDPESMIDASSRPAPLRPPPVAPRPPFKLR